MPESNPLTADFSAKPNAAFTAARSTGRAAHGTISV